MRDGVNFKALEGNKFEIATAQVVDLDEFVKRVSGIEIQKMNFQMQIDMTKKQVETAGKTIENLEKNIGFANEDLEAAYHFLKVNHREDILLKINSKIDEFKKETEKQKAAEGQL